MGALRYTFLIGLLAFMSALSGCSKGLPVNGRVIGQAVDTRVDSEIAQYYVNHYLAGERLRPDLEEQIENVYATHADKVPDRTTLKKLSETYSADFAALFFADRLGNLSRNRELSKLFETLLIQVKDDLEGESINLPEIIGDYEILFVPGFLYKRHPRTGADFSRPQKILTQLAIHHRFVKTQEDGAIEENAKLVAEAILAGRDSERKLIVVSASKSGPEVALALTQLAEMDLSHVAAWLNLVGTMQGSPLAEERLWDNFRYLLGTVDMAGVRSLQPQISQSRFARIQVPDGVIVLNYVGIPVSGSLSYLAKRGYNSMKADGPNDGLSLLPDLLYRHQPTLIEIGSDHFLLTQDIEAKTVALTILIIKMAQADLRIEM